MIKAGLKEAEDRLAKALEHVPGADRDTVRCGITKEGVMALLEMIKAEFHKGTFSSDLPLKYGTLKGAKNLSDVTMDHVVNM